MSDDHPIWGRFRKVCEERSFWEREADRWMCECFELRAKCERMERLLERGTQQRFDAPRSYLKWVDEVRAALEGREP